MRQAAVEVSYLKLADIGIHGNGHFLYLEKNNVGIAEVVSNESFNTQGQRLPNHRLVHT